MAKEQGLSLTDIGAPTIKVAIGDKQVNVYGLSVENLLELLTRFPEAGAWLSPGAVAAADMMKAAPHFLSAVIALATMPEDSEPGGIEKAEKIAAKLSVETQIEIVEAVAKLTFKDGFGPFVKRIADVFGAAASVNFGRVRAMNLPQPSKDLSPPDTTAGPSGN